MSAQSDSDGRRGVLWTHAQVDTSSLLLSPVPSLNPLHSLAAPFWSLLFYSVYLSLSLTVLPFSLLISDMHLSGIFLFCLCLFLFLNRFVPVPLLSLGLNLFLPNYSLIFSNLLRDSLLPLSSQLLREINQNHCKCCFQGFPTYHSAHCPSPF